MTGPPPRFTIATGFPDAQRGAVARLFWDAFSDKLGRLLRPEAQALRFIEEALVPHFALSALDPEGQVLGIAGIKTEAGGLLTAGYRDLQKVYGHAGALWRGPLLDLTERRLEPGQLLMDGIFVAAQARGQGVGQALLREVLAEAARRGCREVRLDVIDRNARARALYERMGFVAVGEERMGLLRYVFGFARSTTMVCAIDREGRSVERAGDAAEQHERPRGPGVR
ncbi:MAG: GNAT family N-acetyltransferase [Pseudomonadota bacterium]